MVLLCIVEEDKNKIILNDLLSVILCVYFREVDYDRIPSYCDYLVTQYDIMCIFQGGGL